MKKFEDYQDEIYTCSRCGLCQSVCPVYDVTKKETMVSRGFFSTLMGVLRGDLTFNKKIRKNIDMCLTCNKCKAFCPSGIDAEKIITSAKIASFSQAPLWKKLATRALYSAWCLRVAGMVRFLPIPPVGFWGKVLNKFLTPFAKYQKQLPQAQSLLCVVIFPGCINSHFNSSSLSSIRMILEQNGVSYTVPEFKCCTMPAYNIGDVAGFVKMAKKNLDRISEEIDFILFDCATCKKAFGIYAEVLEGEYKEKAQRIWAKSRHINEFLVEQKINFVAPEVKIAYHSPCHSDFSSATKELLSSAGKGFELLPEKCCGSAGLFFLENKNISDELVKHRFEAIKCDEVDYLATDCPLCRLGLIRGSVLADADVKIINLVEIFAENAKKLS